MKKAYLLRKRLFAILLIVVLYSYAAVNMVYGYDEWYEEIEEELDGGISLETAPEAAQQIVKEVDESIVEEMYARMNFIETYAYIQVLLGKHEYNNFSFIKDKDGYLHYAAFFREDYNDIEEYAKRVKRLQDSVESRGTKVLFFAAPAKYVRGETEFRTGMPVNDPYAVVDEMLFYLNRYGVETVDCRKYIPNNSLPVEEAFFRTDHHWTIPAAFAATQVLVEQMNEKFDANLDPDHFYMDPAQYEKVVYRRGMLGYMGRKTGAGYSGIEDFTALWPRFENHYDRYCMTETDKLQHFRGTTEQALMNTGVLYQNESVYSNSQYSLYLHELRSYERIINEDNPDGCRILAIRDSFFSPMMVFLAPVCGQLDAIWSLEESDQLDIESYVKENEFDYIILEIYPYNINESAFQFFKENA